MKCSKVFYVNALDLQSNKMVVLAMNRHPGSSDAGQPSSKQKSLSAQRLRFAAEKL